VLVLVDFASLQKVYPSACRDLRTFFRIYTEFWSQSDFQNLEDENTIEFLFYGGWLRSTLTPLASKLIGELNGLTVETKFSGKKITATGKLARGLSAFKGRDLPWTVRNRPGLDTYSLKSLAEIDCGDHSVCPQKDMVSFFARGSCSYCVTVKPGDFFEREEQKLVDSMIVAELVYLTSKKDQSIGLVSADDDMWPGILCALSTQSKIFHLRPKKLGSYGHLYIQTVEAVAQNRYISREI